VLKSDWRLNPGLGLGVEFHPSQPTPNEWADFGDTDRSIFDFATSKTATADADPDTFFPTTSSSSSAQFQHARTHSQELGLVPDLVGFTTHRTRELADLSEPSASLTSPDNIARVPHGASSSRAVSASIPSSSNVAVRSALDRATAAYEATHAGRDLTGMAGVHGGGRYVSTGQPSFGGRLLSGASSDVPMAPEEGFQQFDIPRGPTRMVSAESDLSFITSDGIGLQDTSGGDPPPSALDWSSLGLRTASFSRPNPPSSSAALPPPSGPTGSSTTMFLRPPHLQLAASNNFRISRDDSGLDSLGLGTPNESVHDDDGAGQVRTMAAPPSMEHLPVDTDGDRQAIKMLQRLAIAGDRAIPAVPGTAQHARGTLKRFRSVSSDYHRLSVGVASNSTTAPRDQWDPVVEAQRLQPEPTPEEQLGVTWPPGGQEAEGSKPGPLAWARGFFGTKREPGTSVLPGSKNVPVGGSFTLIGFGPDGTPLYRQVPAPAESHHAKEVSEALTHKAAPHDRGSDSKLSWLHALPVQSSAPEIVAAVPSSALAPSHRAAALRRSRELSHSASTPASWQAPVPVSGDSVAPPVMSRPARAMASLSKEEAMRVRKRLRKRDARRMAAASTHSMERETARLENELALLRDYHWGGWVQSSALSLISGDPAAPRSASIAGKGRVSPSSGGMHSSSSRSSGLGDAGQYGEAGPHRVQSMMEPAIPVALLSVHGTVKPVSKLGAMIGPPAAGHGVAMVSPPSIAGMLLPALGAAVVPGATSGVAGLATVGEALLAPVGEGETTTRKRAPKGRGRGRRDDDDDDDDAGDDDNEEEIMSKNAARREDLLAGPALAAQHRVAIASRLTGAERASAARRAARLLSASMRGIQQELQEACFLVCAAGLEDSCSQSSGCPPAEADIKDLRQQMLREMADVLQLTEQQKLHIRSHAAAVSSTRSSLREVSKLREAHQEALLRGAAASTAIDTALETSLEPAQRDRYVEWATRLIVSAEHPDIPEAPYAALNLALRRSANADESDCKVGAWTPTTVMEDVATRRGLAGTHAREVLESRMQTVLDAIVLGEYPTWTPDIPPPPESSPSSAVVDSVAATAAARAAAATAERVASVASRTWAIHADAYSGPSPYAAPE
jgi:hypothetical protein